MHRRIIALTALTASLALPVAAFGQAATSGSTAPTRHAQHDRVDLAAALAKELGLTTAEVKAALEANRPEAGQRPTDAQKASLAAALGTTVDRLDTLMRSLRPAHGPRPPIREIAKATGKTEDAVKAALEANRPAPGQRPSDAQKASLATALGITTAQLDQLLPPPGHGR